MNPQLKPQPLTAEATLDSRVMFAFAHDLRTHLRTVMTRIQLVQRAGTSALSDGDQSLLHEAETAAAQMEDLLAAMVDYNEAGSPSQAPGQQVARLPLLLRGVVMECRNLLLAASADVHVQNELDVQVPAELQRVLKELLVNASKFRNPARPLRIEITTRREGELLTITVADNGIGVAPEYVERIFAPFQRLHGRDEYPGHGLGLATCRRLVERCGGSITVHPETPDRFLVTITLPLQNG